MLGPGVKPLYGSPCGLCPVHREFLIIVKTKEMALRPGGSPKVQALNVIGPAIAASVRR
jgi:hypothetical protein